MISFSGKVGAVMNRRAALATLGSAGLGLLAMQLPPLYADKPKDEALTRALSKFSAEARERLLRLLKEPGFSGQIRAAEVKAICDGEGKSVDTVTIDLLPLARTYSRPPISHYKVGAVALGVNGDLYLGANLEFPGHSLGFSVHGEQAALSNAYVHADRGVSAIAVTAAPCGHCRQFMNELSPEIKVLVEGKPAVKLPSLLPSAFGPRDLGVTDLAFPVKEVDLILSKGSSDELTVAALSAARKSYAPYTKAHSGVAIGTRTGRVYKGSYIENAAYNPSLPPLQTALVCLVVSGESYSAISEVVLVEVESAPISQRSVAEAVLSAIAPNVKLRVVTAKMKV
jgi:cytidine deaminase